MNTLYFVDVILPIPLSKAFTYSISVAEFEFISPGMRIAVPFGKTKIYTSLALKTHQNAPLSYDPKPIYQILDDLPIVTEKQIEHWQWISKYYLCTLGEVMRSALPSAFIIESETIINKNENKNVDESTLNDNQFLILEALEHQSTLKVSDVESILDKKTVLPIINKMISLGLVKVQETLFEKYKPKKEKYVKLHFQYQSNEALKSLIESLSRAKKQRQVLLTLFSLKAKAENGIKASDLAAQSQVSRAVIKSLIDKNILEEYTEVIDRITPFEESKKQQKQLSQAQQIAFEEVKDFFKKHQVTLLQGVTSSGKTEIYFKLIEEFIIQNKQVLYLLPEIALTTQLVERLKNHFGDKVAVFHSRYSLNERVEVWNKILSQSSKAQIVIGARSALLLPFSNLEFIIIDEEHESSFKQFDPAPRYHARDAAVVLGYIHQAKMLLGSATPSIESYHNTLKGKYGLVKLFKRFNNVQMPEIELVDLAEKYKRKQMTGHFSDALIEQIRLSLQDKQQVILFQNRRGYAPVVSCKTCGNVPQCPNCDVSLTFHQHRNQLRCHYCGYQAAMINQCNVCSSTHIDTKGFGTEQIEAEVKALFPEHKVARMDLDTTKGKYGFAKLISAFEQQRIDILVGTQMLTKGLDFRNVKLVGIINADSLLNFPDFRAHERCYQLLSQVAGRAGRTEIRGKVLIQTYQPLHQILQQVSENAYEKMFQEQIKDRKIYKYPPFERLIKITLKHKDYNTVNTASEWLANYLKQQFSFPVLGPEFPAISRIRNQFHKNIILKVSNINSLSKTKQILIKIKSKFEGIKDFRSVRIILNVDPY